MASTKPRFRVALTVLFAAGLMGCPSTPPAPEDAGLPRRDAMPTDAAETPDAAPFDADVRRDAASPDDAALADAGTPGCLRADVRGTADTARFEDPLGTTTVSIDDREACDRTYTLSTTAVRRDALPENPRRIVEPPGTPSIRTGHDLFDALHALAMAEAREAAVDAIRDHAFDDGRPVSCGEGGCFETGRLWNYVWTRDTAYSVDLGLSAVDPVRARNALAFKVSERRGGGGLEVVQDTGTGGSWPVSTDRVSWALGAAEALDWLEGPERTAFAALALRALRTTIERDRRTVFDAEGGLYRGEQSFLDWREQTYPGWVEGNVVHVGMSRSLSTNVLHLRAFEVASALAREAGDAASAARWEGWSDALRTSIRTQFWDEDAGLYSTFLTTELDRSRVRRWDLLGESLAILSGVATEAQADRILSRYPHLGAAGPGERGAPVIFPQQQRTRIYHNRAEWPFVTAYWLRAARAADHDAVADRAVRSLVRGAALSLSNMENFEAVSGAAQVEEGATSGPVVNSQRQLWSVAGYLSMVHHVLFGLDTETDGLRVRPYVTRTMRRTMFAGTDSLVLRSLAWRGHVLDVVVHLPPASEGGGAYRVQDVRVDGALAADGFVRAEGLGGRARIDVTLGEDTGPASTLTSIDDPADWQRLFGPRTPSITGLTREGGRVRVSFDRGGEADGDVRVAVYRDGARVADALPGTTSSYLDEATDGATRTHCWSIETCFVSSGTCSQHAAPTCDWGAAGERITVVDASRFTAVGGTPVTNHGRFHYEAWGDPGTRLEVPSFTAPSNGRYLVQALFGHGGPVDTGVTCGLKRVLVEDTATGTIVGDGLLTMPHLGTWDRWSDSSFAQVELRAGRTYRVVVRDDDDSVNMSAFQHFAAYTAGLGGRDGAFSRVNIAELRLLHLGP